MKAEKRGEKRQEKGKQTNILFEIIIFEMQNFLPKGGIILD